MDTPVAGPRGGCPFCEHVEEVAEAAPGDVLRDDTYMRLRKEEEGRKKEEEGGGRRRKKEEGGRRRRGKKGEGRGSASSSKMVNLLITVNQYINLTSPSSFDQASSSKMVNP